MKSFQLVTQFLIRDQVRYLLLLLNVPFKSFCISMTCSGDNNVLQGQTSPHLPFMNCFANICDFLQIAMAPEEKECQLFCKKIDQLGRKKILLQDYGVAKKLSVRIHESRQLKELNLRL